MQEYLDLFQAEGDAHEVPANSPLLLNDPESVWLVIAGYVDVFAVPLDGGEPAGTRFHLFRSGPASLLLGAAPAVEPLPGLLAAGIPETRVMRLARARLVELGNDPVRLGPLAALLDRWLGGLTAGLVRGQTPQDSLFLEPGKQFSLAAGEAVAPSRGTVWVHPAAGPWRLLGKTDLASVITDCLFPLSAPAWLVAASKAALTAAATPAVFTDVRLGKSLDRFHHVVLAHTAEIARQEAETARRRRQARSLRDRQMLGGMLLRLATLGKPEEQDATTVLDGSPLLAACQLVAGAQGIQVQAPSDPGDNRRRCDPVEAIARASRCRVRRVRLAGDWWRQDNGPLLGFRADAGQPVALLPRWPARYEVVNPADASRAPVTPASAATLSPAAYCFYRPFPARALTVWDVLRAGLANSATDRLLIVLLGLASSVLALAVPLATGWVFDEVVPSGDRNTLILVVLALLACGLSGALFQLARVLAALRLETRMDGVVQAGVWDRLLNLPVPFFRGYTAGDLAARAMGMRTIRQILSDAAVSSAFGSLFSLVYFGLLFYYNVRLALLAVLLFLVVLAVTINLALLQLRYQRGVQKLRGKTSGLVLQLVTGISRLRVAGAEDRALALWAGDFSAQRRLAFRARAVANQLSTFQAAVPLLMTVVLFGTVSLLPADSLSLGAFLAFNVAFLRIFMVAGILGAALSSLAQVVPLYERAQPILQSLPEADASRAAPGALSGDIEMNHVSFRYQQDGPAVLQDVSLHVRPGEFVAFAGPSGAGKSTLLRLLLGFEVPQSGAISYDRQSLAGLDLQGVRRQMGTVLQNGRLLSGDVFSNIVGSAPLSEEDAWEAARLSGLDEDIRQMPMGMHTLVAEGGSTLSGGQRQRLLIARALVTRPRILLFDEATSALDNRTQALVSRSLEGLNVTRVVVAHRLSTIRNADRIYVLDAGRIVQQGTYDELIGQQGLFADLARRQLV
jgi:NHLM bacteriocin system ABC transporter ATP-binding protein